MLRIGLFASAKSVAATALFCAALSAQPAWAMDGYYLALFAAERRPLALPELSHSFGTFIRVTDQQPGPPGCRVEAFTLSWMPQSLAIRLARLAPECGVN